MALAFLMKRFSGHQAAGVYFPLTPGIVKMPARFQNQAVISQRQLRLVYTSRPDFTKIGSTPL